MLDPSLSNMSRVVIAVTFFIYIRAGHTIYRKRKDLDDFSSTDRDLTSHGDMLATVKTTEVLVTTEALSPNNAIHLQTMDGRDISSSINTNGAYSVHISADTSSGDIADEVLPVQNQLTHTVSHSAPVQRPGGNSGNPTRRRNRDVNNAAWQYTKCAILFFTAILITWIPSTANRVYSVFHTQSSSVPLEFMSAFVLPLQGWWNALIYMVTTWGACKNLVSDLKMGRRPDVTELIGGMAPEIHHRHHDPHQQQQQQQHSHHRHNLGQFRTGNRSNKTYETESMTELAISRPTSDDGTGHYTNDIHDDRRGDV